MSTLLKLTLGCLFLACGACSCSAASCCAPDKGTCTIPSERANTATLVISGMTCEGCVSKVEKGLSALPNVTKATVDFKSKEAVVLVTGTIDTAVLIKAVEKSGFEAIATSSQILDISGMTCQGCVSKVEKSLAALPNVQKVTVSFEDKKAVALVAGKVDVATLIKAVEKGGFKATETLPKKE